MPKPLSLVVLLALCCFAPVAKGAESVTLVLKVDTVLNQIDEKVYGQFLEHIYHSCNGGLWGELIWDRSFEGSAAGKAWSLQGERVVQEGGAADVRLTFGDPSWTDYEFTLEARKTGGQEGFLLLLRALNDKEFYWANLGGWGNDGHALERGIKGQTRWGPVTPRRPGQIEKGRWYRLRARCEGAHIQVWLDDELVLDYTDDGKGPTHGRVGIGTWQTQAQFRNLKVTSLTGETLFQGLPELQSGAPGAAPAWRSFGAVQVQTSTEGALNGERCKQIVCTGAGGGLSQQPLNVHAKERYRGSLWARGAGQVRLAARLTGDDRLLASSELPALSDHWQELPLDLTPTADCDHATLQIAAQGAGTVWLDQVSLMPESWRAAGGFRPDLLQGIAALRPPVIRWPGGCYASSYRWKDGIGPQHKRRAHPRTIWDDKDVNSFGTDEFVSLCRKVGAAPLIVVNIGTPNWNRSVLDNDFLQEVLDWIEYCNGPADSKWGKVRAANGHPEPYGVKYWEIDNETWHMGAETYAEWVNRFAPAMRKADPSIKLAACGSGGYGKSAVEWNRVLIDQCADKLDYLSLHHYHNPNDFAAGPAAYEQFFRQMGDLLAQSANPKLKLYVSEWNAQSTDWRTGLYCGGLLNAFERSGDVVGMGGPALFLRHVSATAWDNAFLNFDRRTWFPAPNYVVMKLWHDHYARNRVAVDGEPGPLNVVATRSADGRQVILKAVNPTIEAVPVEATVPGVEVAGATLTLVAPGSTDARNTLAAPSVVRPEAGKVETTANTLRFTMPPLSCGVVVIEKR